MKSVGAVALLALVVPCRAPRGEPAAAPCAGIDRAAGEAFALVAQGNGAAGDAECQNRLARRPAEAEACVAVRFLLDADQCVPVIAVRVVATGAGAATPAWSRRAASLGWVPPAGDPATAMPVAFAPESFVDRGAATTVFVGQVPAATRRPAEKLLRRAVDRHLGR